MLKPRAANSLHQSATAGMGCIRQTRDFEPGETCGAHAIHNVAGEAEGHQLRSVQEAPLLKGNPQINVHYLSRLAVQQYVVAVSVPQPNNVSCIQWASCDLLAS